MSDHADYSDVGTAAGFEGDDEQYFSMVSGTAKPKPQAPARVIDSDLIREIEQAIRPFDYSDMDFETARRLSSADVRRCPFCKFEHADWYSMKTHVAEHDEVQQVLDDAARSARRLEGLRERKAQVTDSMARLQAQARGLDKELQDFDNEGLAQKQRLRSRLSSLLY